MQIVWTKRQSLWIR